MIDEIRWKFVAAVSIVAMAVSLISGGLSGISFGVLVVRALVGGAIFAILAIALNLLAVRLFPEILESASAAEVDPEAPGGRVDITMPAESPTFMGDEEDFSSGNPEAGNRGSELDDEGISDVEPVDDDSDKPAETLGDLDRFSGTFSEADEFSEARDRKSKGSGSDQDPEELAQAIHTVIKRDEKG